MDKNEEKIKKLETLVNLREALHEFGEAWSCEDLTAEPACESFVEVIKGMIHLYPDRVDATICLSAILHVEMDLAISSLAELPKEKEG